MYIQFSIDFVKETNKKENPLILRRFFCVNRCVSQLSITVTKYLRKST
jgi:hypothetical protein